MANEEQTVRSAKALITTAAVAAALGVGATSAQGYSISGIAWNPYAYTGASTAAATFKLARLYTVECQDMSVSGSATGSWTTDFTPTYSNCSFVGFPATVSQSGNWSTGIVAGPTGGGTYYADFSIPPWTTTIISVPIAGCTVTISGSQWVVAPVHFQNSWPGAEMDIDVHLVNYTASGCPFSSGTDGTIESNGPINIPGITVS